MKKDDNLFLLDWGWGVVRNCDNEGNLIVPGRKGDFLKSDRKLWVALKLCLFSDGDTIFGIWACENCMHEVISFDFRQQNRTVIESRQCHHSRVMSELGEDFKERYKDYLPNDANTWYGEDIFASDESQTVIMRSEKEDGLCLVGYRNKGKISLLFTIGPKNTIPLCSQCLGHIWTNNDKNVSSATVELNQTTFHCGLVRVEQLAAAWLQENEERMRK